VHVGMIYIHEATGTNDVERVENNTEVTGQLGVAKQPVTLREPESQNPQISW